MNFPDGFVLQNIKNVLCSLMLSDFSPRWQSSTESAAGFLHVWVDFSIADLRNTAAESCKTSALHAEQRLK